MKRDKRWLFKPGDTIGDLTVVGCVGKTDQGSIWFCKCECEAPQLRSAAQLNRAIRRRTAPQCPRCLAEYRGGLFMQRRKRLHAHYLAAWEAYGDLYGPDYDDFEQQAIIRSLSQQGMPPPTCALSAADAQRTAAYTWRRPAPIVYTAGNLPKTRNEIAEEFQVTTTRIGQVEAKALSKLRHPSRSRQLRPFVDRLGESKGLRLTSTPRSDGRPYRAVDNYFRIYFRGSTHCLCFFKDCDERQTRRAYHGVLERVLALDDIYRLGDHEVPLSVFRRLSKPYDHIPEIGEPYLRHSRDLVKSKLIFDAEQLQRDRKQGIVTT
jgi:hypothetical protein